MGRRGRERGEEKKEGREEKGGKGKIGRRRQGRGGEGICRTNVKLLPTSLKQQDTCLRVFAPKLTAVLRSLHKHQSRKNFQEQSFHPRRHDVRISRS